MDHKPSNSDTDSWVDDRMAKLDPARDWTPDSGRALKRLNQRQPAFNAPWMRVGMTATILAATVLVLVLLPWQRLWKPKPVAMVAALTQTTPAEKPAEKTQETPTPKQPAEPAPQAPAAKTQQFDDTIFFYAEEASEEANKLRQHLAELTKARSFTTGASQATDPTPVVVRNVLPEYSDEARKAKIQGTVIVTITVKADGTVQFESFKQTLGYGLDEKARAAVEQWLFTPAKKDGVPVAKTIDVSMHFSLR